MPPPAAEHGDGGSGRTWTSGLSTGEFAYLRAQEFVKLIESGWVPVDLALGLATSLLPELSFVRRRGRRLPRDFGGGFIRNAEIGWWSDVVERTRQQARFELRADRSADGVVVSRCDLAVHELRGRKYVEARFIGTAITAFRDTARRPKRSLADRLTGVRAFPPAPASRTTSILRLEPPEDGPDAAGARPGPIR